LKVDLSFGLLFQSIDTTGKISDCETYELTTKQNPYRRLETPLKAGTCVPKKQTSPLKQMVKSQ